MTEKTIIQELNERAISDNYLYELLEKIQLNYGYKIFQKEWLELTEQEFLDVLRFSDILSRSDQPLNRNIALKIVSILFDDYQNDEVYQLFSKNVFVKLGNFPSLTFIENSGNDINNDEISYDEIVKKIFQKTTVSNQYFTDSQYDIFNRLKNTNHYSFSASTSFGKSFMFVEYIKWLIESKNASENFAFLVPTRALITQVIDDLSENIKNPRYKIIQNAEIPALFNHDKFIFVFTPERLISYFSNPNPENPEISTIIIDEAHNTISGDERSPMFYHAISLAKQKSINLFFASPNVPNPELFLNLVGNDPEKSKHIEDLNVIQNKYFIDLTTKQARIYFDYLKEDKSFIEFEFGVNNDLSDLISDLSGKSQSLIYCNAIADTVSFSENMAEKLSDKGNKELIDLADYIRDTVHDLYYLAEFIEKGVAFHFGGLPQIIRVRVEEQFKKGNIQYLFTTSTLLQGVNLPAKNLFVLTDQIGLRDLTELDFRNLVGRAGRLSKELVGNIFVVKKDESKWKEKSQKLINKQELPRLTSQILEKNNQNFYTNIGNIIQGKELTNREMAKWKQRQLVEYAGIISYQTKRNVDSVLSTQFSQRNKEAKQILKDISKFEVTDDILMTSITIKPVYQEQILREKEHFEFPKEIDYTNIVKVLEQMSSKYNWVLEEDGRQLGKEEKIPYYAVLMTDWMNSQSLNLIIKSTLKYMGKNNSQFPLNNDHKNYVIFNKDDSSHINYVINELMKDIENIIRFKIKNYITNYLKLTNQEGNDWQKYLDYGTNDFLIIELQKIGFERQAAIELKKKAEKSFEINDTNEIVKIDINSLISSRLSDETMEQVNFIFEYLKEEEIHD